MTFRELKKIIDEAQKKTDLMLPISFSVEDKIEIISIIYNYGIPCNNISSVSDIYDVISKYQLDSELFKKPYYLKVNLQSFNENTINIINQISDNVFVEVSINDDIDSKKIQLLSRISHTKCQFVCNNWIDLDSMYLLTNKFTLSEESSPVIVIRKIDSTTAGKIASVCQKINNSRFRIEIKDAESLQNLDRIIPYIPVEEILVELSNDLFDEKNPQNARNTIVQYTKDESYINKKLHIIFREIKYDNMEQIYDLEKNIGLIKSHIPENASKLDIITYVTLFMINYFKYDYTMYEETKTRPNNEDINLAQFISRGRGVCRHFASFTEYILNSLGIDCKKVDSLDNYYEDYNSEGHAFNVVTIDGKSYFLDNTWIVEGIQNGLIHSLSESSDYLRSNEEFGHTDYDDVLSEYHCESYNRQEINDSVNRVIKWNDNYIIHPSALRDLFRKHILRKEKSVAERIEEAIPRRI